MRESTANVIYPLVGALEVTIADAGRFSNVAIVRSYSTSFVMRAGVFLASCVLLVGIGAFFVVAAGAWPVLFFCMLQAAVLARVWAELELHADDHEFVSVDDDAVLIDAMCRKRTQQCRFQRHWARAVWSAERERLCLRSHGREVEIAAGASKDDKLALYRHLGRLLGTARAAAGRA